MKDNFLQLTTCHSGLVYCRLVVIEKFIFYDEILSIAISCGKHQFSLPQPQLYFKLELSNLLDEIKKTSTLSSLGACILDTTYTYLYHNDPTFSRKIIGGSESNQGRNIKGKEERYVVYVFV